MLTLDCEAVIENYRDTVAYTPIVRGRLTPEAIAKGPAVATRVKKAKAVAAWGELAKLMKTLRDGGLTFQAIADTLNAEGEVTRYGSPFDAANVYRVINKYA